jgi:hypothetical protein
VGVEGIELNLEYHAALKRELSGGLVAHKVVTIARSPLRPDGAGRVLGSKHYRDTFCAVAKAGK